MTTIRARDSMGMCAVKLPSCTIRTHRLLCEHQVRDRFSSQFPDPKSAFITGYDREHSPVSPQIKTSFVNSSRLRKSGRRRPVGGWRFPSVHQPIKASPSEAEIDWHAATADGLVSAVAAAGPSAAVAAGVVAATPESVSGA